MAPAANSHEPTARRTVPTGDTALANSARNSAASAARIIRTSFGGTGACSPFSSCLAAPAPAIQKQMLPAIISAPPRSTPEPHPEAFIHTSPASWPATLMAMAHSHACSWAMASGAARVRAAWIASWAERSCLADVGPKSTRASSAAAASTATSVGAAARLARTTRPAAAHV
eukprot:scaffold7921_cov109-Isochrysis_galbana.AAC.4